MRCLLFFFGLFLSDEFVSFFFVSLVCLAVYFLACFLLLFLGRVEYEIVLVIGRELETKKVFRINTCYCIIYSEHRNDITSIVKLCRENMSQRRVFSVKFDYSCDVISCSK